MLANEPQRQIHVTQRRAGGDDLSGFDEHARFVELYSRIARSKQRGEPPRGRRIVIVEQPGLGQEERTDTGRAHRRSARRPLPKHGRRIPDVGPGQRSLQRLGHLEADRRHHDAIGHPLRRRTNRHGKTLRGLDVPANADHRDVKPRCRRARQIGQLVGRLKRVKNGGEAGVEDVIQREHEYTHGKNGINNGVFVNSHPGAGPLTSGSRRRLQVGVFRFKEVRCETRIVRPSRSEARKGERRRRLPPPGSRARQPGSDHPHVVRAAAGAVHLRHLRCVRRRGRTAAAPERADRAGADGAGADALCGASGD